MFNYPQGEGASQAPAVSASERRCAGTIAYVLYNFPFAKQVCVKVNAIANHGKHGDGLWRLTRLLIRRAWPEEPGCAVPSSSGRW